MRLGYSSVDRTGLSHDASFGDETRQRAEQCGPNDCHARTADEQLVCSCCQKTGTLVLTVALETLHEGCAVKLKMSSLIPDEN